MPILMSTQSSPKATERLRMRPWLEKKLNTQSIPGFEWVDKDKGTFRIPWKHAARHGWDKNKDACLFMEWAIHTGKYSLDSGERGNPKTWKANFRCALNSLPDIQEMAKMSNRKGNNAFKVYKMLPRKLTERKRKIGTLTKTRKSATRTNDRATNYLKNNKHKAATTNDALRPRTRSMSRETERCHEEAQVKTEVDDEDNELDSQVEIEIDPEEKHWSQSTTIPMTTETYSSPYLTPPQSAGYIAPTNTVSGFVPPLVTPQMTRSTPTAVTSIPSTITSPIMTPSQVKTETRTEGDFEFRMNVDDDDDAGSNGSGSVPTDDEVVEMVHEMINDSPGPSSPVNGFNHNNILLELKPSNPVYPPLTESLLQSHQNRCSALAMTESWIAQLDSQQGQRESEELPLLTEIPKPTFIKVPGDLDQYSEFATELSTAGELTSTDLFSKIESLT